MAGIGKRGGFVGILKGHRRGEGRIECWRRRTLVAVAALAGLAPPGGCDLLSLADAIDRPVAGAAVAASGAIAVGRGQLIPGAGAVVRPLFAAGERCGVWIEGPGELRYSVTDRMSLPVAKRNLKSASNLSFDETPSGLVVREPFDGALVWSWDVGAGGGPEPGAPMPEWARSALERALVSPPAHDLLLARATKTTGVAFALVHGRQGDLLLAVDPTVDARIETLARLKEISSRSMGDLAGRTRYVELVAQPVGREWSEAPGLVVRLVSGDVSVVAGADESARIEARLRLRAEVPGLSRLRLGLVAATLDEVKEYPVVVERVAIDGNPAPARHQGGELLVELPRALAVGETVELAVVHSGRFAVQPGGDSYWTMAWDDWLPMPHPLPARHGSWHLTVRSRGDFLPYASGETVTARREGESQVLESRLDGPFRSVTLGAGNYDVEEIRADDGLVVRVASYVFAKARQRQMLANNLLAAREYFTRIFGVPYPFREIDVVEINDWGFGMAPPGVIFITREAFDPAAIIRLEGAEGFSRGVNGRFVHEVAHAWWAHVVQYPTGEEQWLSESFAEYASALCLEAMRGGGKAGEREFRSAYSEWKSRAGDLGAGASVYLANRLAFEDDRDRWDRVNLLYNRGPLVIHAIRRELARLRGNEAEGDRYFFAFLKSVVKNFDRKPAATRHLIGILGQMTGTDWRPFFDRYVYGTEMPPLG